MTDLDDLHAVLNIITSGDDEMRQDLAARIAAECREDVIAALAATARSSEPLLLRSRCLEVLSIVARDGDDRVFRTVMAAFRRDERDA